MPFGRETVQVAENQAQKAAPAEEWLRLPSEASESQVVLTSLQASVAPVARLQPVTRRIHSAVWEPGVEALLMPLVRPAPTPLTRPVVAFSGQGEMAPIFHLQAQN